MAALTPATGWPRTNIIGSYRCVMAKFITLTANGDTWATGLKVIKAVNVASSGAGVHPIGATVSGGTVTFTTDGTADAAVFCSATGW